MCISEFTLVDRLGDIIRYCVLFTSDRHFWFPAVDKKLYCIFGLKRPFQQVLYITVGATVESSVPSHYVHLSFSDDWFDNRK